MRRPAALLLAVSLLAGCHLPSSGPPLPDAESIVEGTAGPGARVDTTDAPFAVALDRARWRLRQQGGRAPRDFWSAIAVLDIADAERIAVTLDERTFVIALKSLLESDPEVAAVGFAALHSRADDAALRARARVGLTMALTWRSDWAAIARLSADPDSLELALLDPRAVQSGVERWARAFGGLPPAAVLIPEGEFTIPLRRSAFGTPVITVMVNGTPREFWLDTGASMTILSADVAAQTGVSLLSTDTLALSVVSGHIDARAVFIDSLGIGPIRVRGLSAAVVAPGVLRLDQQRVNGVVRDVPIDGVIGTDLLRHLDLTIDVRAGTITIRKPRPRTGVVRNLFWVGYPVVRFVTRDGQPALFGLDTGAEGSFITTSMLRKLPRTPVAMRRGTLGGLGTEKEHTEWVARDLSISDGDYAIALRNTPVAAERRWTFIAVDGVIGSDVAMATRLHLDFQNGVFDVRGEERARP